MSVQDMYNPLVSIIIPVYNGSNYLKQSIDSALEQTYKNIEVIVVNDGSDDDGVTESIALSYGEKIRYFYKENGGVSTALNLGISKMKGEWFSWLSHDDLYLPDKIKSQIEKVTTNNLDPSKTILSCKTGLIDALGKPLLQPKKFVSGLFSGEKMFKMLFIGNALAGCSLLIPKSALMEVHGFDVKYRYIQDWTCWIKLALSSNNFYLFDEELVKSRIHGKQDQVRLSHLFPGEIDDFLIEILDYLSDKVETNHYYIKTILIYFCTRRNNKEVKEIYKSRLKETNDFNIKDSAKYILFLMYGRVMKQIKKIYRLLMDRVYRGVK